MRPLTDEEIEYYDLQSVDMRLEDEQIKIELDDNDRRC